MANTKTNAMRILAAKKIDYDMFTYSAEDGKIDGMSVAQKIGKNPEYVYKTLVTQGSDKQIYVFVIPIEREVDLKKAAKAANVKKLDMLPVKDIQKWTGYIRGGCSPVGMKKLYPTFFDEHAANIDCIVVSGGKIGIQIEVEVRELQEIVEAKFADVVK
ncbi:Cys-tRNA(Pro) deacylase [Metabacillus fastidiosus]|uniref:Cys-tRNA(Pro) deacylase n=1 Tax=Metabacillus fastidiosus TaxID=1458 RepID=UPI003D29DF19